MQNENQKIFMSPVDKEALTKFLKSKIKIGVRIRTCFMTSVFWALIFTAVTIGMKSESQPDALALCEEKNSEIYQTMDQQIKEISSIKTALGRVVETSDLVKKTTSETNQKIRHEMTAPGLKE